MNEFTQKVVAFDTALVHLKEFVCDKAPTDKDADVLWLAFGDIMDRAHFLIDPLYTKDWVNE